MTVTEAQVLEVAQRVAQIPLDVLQLNKRVVHRQMEMMGFRTALRKAARPQTCCAKSGSSSCLTI